MSLSNELNEGFGYLDQTSFRSLYTDLDRTPTKMQFLVRGIRCSKCIRKIESLKETNPQIADIRVQIGLGLTDVIMKSKDFSFGEVANEIHDLGFEPVPIAIAENKSEIVRNETRAELIRLAVAGFCAGNIMTFAFASYAGLTGQMETIFRWLSFALYLPVVGYVALPFYRGFYQAIRNKSLSIDGPIAIASLAGFIFSTVNLVLGRSGIYFDSTAGFLFLILTSRFIQKRLQRSFLNDPILAGVNEMNRAWLRLEDGTFEIVPTSTLKFGDVIRLKHGQIVPADGRLLAAASDDQSGEKTATLNLSYLTGESHPKTFTANMLLPAGAQLLDEQVDLKIEAVGVETVYGRILAEIQGGVFSKVKALTQADRWSQILLFVVFGAAFAFAIGYSFVNVEQALERSLALLILACPCAMAFGTPLALAFSLRNAAKSGLLIKSADLFSKMNQIDTVFLDKTGTITKTKLAIRSQITLARSESNLSTEFIGELILALQSKSLHPIAFAFRDHFVPNLHSWDALKLKSELSDIQEQAGVGVSGILHGNRYSVKSFKTDSIGVHQDQELKKVALYENDRALEVFELESSLHPGSQAAVLELQNLGKKVYLLSGDEEKFVKELGRQVGIEPQDCFSNQTPESKAAMVAKYPNSLMIGDGINDALAFKLAKVSLAVSGSVEMALQAADGYFSKEGISSVVELFKISREAEKLINRNLRISVVYNSIGGIGALLGLVNPFIAAIAMPISSGFILLSSVISARKTDFSKQKKGSQL